MAGPEMNSHIVLIAVLAFALLAVLVTLFRRDRNAHSAIDLEDLLIGEDGKLSKSACVLLGSFLMTTWVIVYLTYTGKLTDMYFATYVTAWVTPTVTKLIVNARSSAPSQPAQKSNQTPSDE